MHGPSGSIWERSKYTYYRSNTSIGKDGAYVMFSNLDNNTGLIVYDANQFRGRGYSIRCVAGRLENQPTLTTSSIEKSEPMKNSFSIPRRVPDEDLGAVLDRKRDFLDVSGMEDGLWFSAFLSTNQCCTCHI